MTAYLRPGDKIVLVLGNGDTPRESRENQLAIKAWFEALGITVAVTVNSGRAHGLSVPVVIRDER